MVVMTMIAVSRNPIVLGLLSIGIAACVGSTSASLPPTPLASGSPSPSGSVVPRNAGTSAPVRPSTEAVDSQQPGDSQAPDTGGGTSAGDVPDNAVFLTYRQVGLGFSIRYVEGWQVTTRPDGVVIHDKDSSETVTVALLPKDVAAYIAATDLPALQVQAGFRFVKQDTVKVGGATYHHLVYHALSPLDLVTNKRVACTVDR